MKLSTKMTLAFVAFGVLPAAVIWAFATYSDNKAKDWRAHSLKQAATAAASGVDRLILKNGAGDKPPAPAWDQIKDKQDDVMKVFNDVAADFEFPSAAIYLIGT